MVRGRTCLKFQGVKFDAAYPVSSKGDRVHLLRPIDRDEEDVRSRIREKTCLGLWGSSLRLAHFEVLEKFEQLPKSIFRRLRE